MLDFPSVVNYQIGFDLHISPTQGVILGVGSSTIFCSKSNQCTNAKLITHFNIQVICCESSSIKQQIQIKLKKYKMLFKSLSNPYYH
jgi:hypothetical protein